MLNTWTRPGLEITSNKSKGGRVATKIGGREESEKNCLRVSNVFATLPIVNLAQVSKLLWGKRTTSTSNGRLRLFLHEHKPDRETAQLTPDASKELDSHGDAGPPPSGLDAHELGVHWGVERVRANGSTVDVSLESLRKPRRGRHIYTVGPRHRGHHPGLKMWPHNKGSSINPFTPKNDQFQISPSASQEILHHTV